MKQGFTRAMSFLGAGLVVAAILAGITSPGAAKQAARGNIPIQHTVSAGTVRIPTVASARQGTPPSSADVIRIKMTGTFINRVMSISDVGVTITLQNGQTLTVPTDVYDRYVKQHPGNTHGAFSLDNVVEGDCGYSYIYLSQRSGYIPYRMDTGFHVYSPAWYYHWNAGIGGPGVQYNYNASGDLDNRSDWHGGHTGDGLHGDYFASVSTNYSYAFTDNGQICSSGGPTDEQFL
jgi:hypothetical protein